MKRYLGLILTSLFLGTPMLLAQEAEHEDHGEVGIFVEYFRFADPNTTTNNYIGLGPAVLEDTARSGVIRCV